jgi:hypothetical protein
MTETHAQVDRRRNREQWYVLVDHLLDCGYTISQTDGVDTLVSPTGVRVMSLPNGYVPSAQAAASAA